MNWKIRRLLIAILVALALGLQMASPAAAYGPPAAAQGPPSVDTLSINW